MRFPRKKYPECIYRGTEGQLSLWEKIVTPEQNFRSAVCGNNLKVPECPARERSKPSFFGICKNSDCPLDLKQGCCWWCPFPRRVRMGEDVK